MGCAIMTRVAAGLRLLGRATSTAAPRRRTPTMPRPMGAALAALDRHTLADIGLGPGEIVWAAHATSADRLRCRPQA
jgi:hypothetical protein